MSLVMFRRGRLLKLTIVIFCLVLLILFLLPNDRKGQGQVPEPVVRPRASRVSNFNSMPVVDEVKWWPPQ